MHKLKRGLWAIHLTTCLSRGLMAGSSGVPVAVEPERRSLGDGLTWLYLPLSLSLDASGSVLRDAFRSKVAPVVLPDWDTDTVCFDDVTEGMSNRLLCISRSGGGTKLALRLYGCGTELYVDRGMEAAVMLLAAAAGLSAPLVCQFENGLIYDWLPGRSLRREEMGEEGVMGMVARTMARLHATQVPPGYGAREPALWHNLDGWLAHLELSPPDSCLFRSPQFAPIGCLAALRSEVERLRAGLSSTRSPVLLCHNDLSSLNIIYQAGLTPRVSLIDLEYAAPNYQAFDIGNHFCEFAGVHTLDFTLFPSEAVQKQWIRLYLEESDRLAGTGRGVRTEEVNLLYREVGMFALSSHLMWCVWGLLQQLNSTIHCDYVSYAAARFTEYQRRKEEFYAL